MTQDLFKELKTYVRFDQSDEQSLQAFLPHARSHFPRLSEEFYSRLDEHEEARSVFKDRAQVERLKSSLADWLETLLSGPWDSAYFQKRMRIGRVHVNVGLAQRYMFTAMNLLRSALTQIAQGTHVLGEQKQVTIGAVNKIIDIELAVMLESYREAYIEKVRQHERSVRQTRASRLAALGTMAAGLAHEIRNPLNAAHLQLNLAQRRLARLAAEAADPVMDSVDRADTEIRRLASLVEEFLEFARPQQLKFALVDLCSTARTVVEFMHPEADTLGIDLKLQGASALMADLDEEKIKQVLINLIRNAMDASQRGQSVTVACQQNDGCAELSVRDNGEGVQEPFDRIFEPFFTTKDKGTGLGLALAHRIVTDHDGVLSVESGHGTTTFTIRVPLTRETHTNIPIDKVDQNSLSD